MRKEHGERFDWSWCNPGLEDSCLRTGLTTGFLIDATDVNHKDPGSETGVGRIQYTRIADKAAALPRVIGTRKTERAAAGFC